MTMTAVPLNPFRFNVKKATQAVGVILRAQRAHRMNYMKLLKLIEIAERETLKEIGTMITGDQIVAMDRGPLPSEIYNLIKGEHLDVRSWDEFISKDGYHIELISSPGVETLSRAEIQKLEEVTLRHANDDEWVMVKKTHEFEEWKKNKPESGSCKRIPVRDILVAVGCTEEEADEIIADAVSQAELDLFFARNKICSRKMPLPSQV